jgi:guanine nucleotide-binding protein subunit gamma 3, plant
MKTKTSPYFLQNDLRDIQENVILCRSKLRICFSCFCCWCSCLPKPKTPSCCSSCGGTPCCRPSCGCLNTPPSCSEECCSLPSCGCKTRCSSFRVPGFQRLRGLPLLLLLLPLHRLLLRVPVCRMLRWLHRCPEAVPELQLPAFMLQVPESSCCDGEPSCCGGPRAPPCPECSCGCVCSCPRCKGGCRCPPCGRSGGCLC